MNEFETVDCPVCDGDGEVLNMEPDVPWYFTRCWRCAGAGTILEDPEREVGS